MIKGANFNKLPRLENYNEVGLSHGRWPVSDHKGGSVTEKVFYRRQNVTFGNSVQARRRLVQNDDRCIPPQCACYRDALPLTSRETLSTLAKHGFVTFRKFVDELVRVGQPGGTVDSFAVERVRTVGDVFDNGRPK